MPQSVGDKKDAAVAREGKRATLSLRGN